jgi:hypothetical protein
VIKDYATEWRERPREREIHLFVEISSIKALAVRKEV